MLRPSGRLTSGGDGEPTMDEMEEKKRIAERGKEGEGAGDYTNIYKYSIHSLKLTSSLPLKIGQNAPKGNNRIPTIHPFSGAFAATSREGKTKKP